MDRSSESLSWVKKHKLGFLVRMWHQKEPLLLLRGGYWRLPSVEDWHTDIDFVTEADSKGYVEKSRSLPDGCLDGRILTRKGEEFAKNLIQNAAPKKIRHGPMSVPAASVQSAPMPPRTPQPVSRPALAPSAIQLLGRLEKVLLEDPNCFTLRACCEAIPQFKAVAYPEKYPRSGIIGCLAGLTCLCLADGHAQSYVEFLNKSHSQLAQVAASKLGLTATEADRLFAHWSFEFLQSYRRARSSDERAKIAIARIKRFVETGE